LEGAGLYQGYYYELELNTPTRQDPAIASHISDIAHHKPPYSRDVFYHQGNSPRSPTNARAREENIHAHKLSSNRYIFETSTVCRPTPINLFLYFSNCFYPDRAARPLSGTPRRHIPADLSEIPPTPITHFSEVEAAMQDTVSKFANDVILPKVRDMDEAEVMDPTIVEQLFEQGMMGIEIPEEFGGAGMNFTSAIVCIEELARIDPSVSVMVDVHNTLVNTAVMKYGSQDIRRRYLPKLATNTVG
jgi:hypothetical protein